METNWALHERIAAICPNTMARAVYVSTLGHLTGTSPTPAETPDRPAAYRSERLRVHAELVEAIAAGDQDRVRSAVERHHASS